MTGKQRQAQGLAGQLAVMKKLVEKGYDVFVPAGDHCAFDVISCKDGMHLTRISVKSTSYLDGKSWRVDLRQQSGGMKKRPFNRTSCDVVAVYIAPENRVKFFKTEEITNKSNLSVKPI